MTEATKRALERLCDGLSELHSSLAREHGMAYERLGFGRAAEALQEALKEEPPERREDKE